MTQNRMTFFLWNFTLSWCLDPETVSDFGFHPLRKQRCSCTCSCRFEFSPTSGKMYSPLFLIKNVLAITLGSYPSNCLHTCFSPPLWVLWRVAQHLMKKAGLSKVETIHYVLLLFLSLSSCLSVFPLTHGFVLYGSWLSPSQQPRIMAWPSSCFKIMPLATSPLLDARHLSLL